MINERTRAACKNRRIEFRVKEESRRYVVPIAQMVGCLLVAGGHRVDDGVAAPQLRHIGKRQQLSEIASRRWGREHELDTLNAN
ncbi:MAG: hypothetical protein U0231_13750 [Nitrospiraceae bacterium]